MVENGIARCALPESVDVLEAAQVMEALQSIDETFRVPLALFYLQEHSYEEIAQILEIPIGTVMSRLSRGKQKLQQAFLQLQARPGARIIPFSETQVGDHRG